MRELVLEKTNYYLLTSKFHNYHFYKSFSIVIPQIDFIEKKSNFLAYRKN